MGAPNDRAGQPTLEPDPALGGKPVEAFPPELTTLQQWVTHVRKVPKNARTGGNADPTNPATWATFKEAVAAVHRYGHDGLGFATTLEDGLVLIDIDGCRNARTGELDARATGLLEQFPGAYWEVSPSGAGIHGIGRGALPEGGRGRHPQGIGIFGHSRYFTMTGDALAGHESLGDFGADLAAFYDEVSPPQPRQPASAPTLTLDDNDVIERLNREPSGKAARLLAGDATAYPDYSTARFALANKSCFYTDDGDQIARVIRSSGLFKDGDPERERDRKAALDARNGVDQYIGPRYDPAYGQRAPLPMIVPPIAVGATCDEQLTHAQDTIALLTAQLQDAQQTITLLQERARLSDEREAITRNTKLGASRQTASALASLFQEERPREPGTATPYRMPLAKIAERTGLSADSCSRQIKTLATYRTPDGSPVLFADTRFIDREVDEETGEITEPHREVWLGPAVDRSAFGHVMAQLAPADAPKHGGKPDRNACPEHPDAGVLRRTKTTRKITRECAHCHLVLDVQVIPVGRETTEHIPAGRPTQHHAFTHEGDDPETTDPIQHHAFGDDDASEPGLGPMPQHARSIDNHVGYDLSRILPDSPRLLNDARPDPTGAAPGWEDDRRRVYGELYRGGVTS